MVDKRVLPDSKAAAEQSFDNAGVKCASTCLVHKSRVASFASRMAVNHLRSAEFQRLLPRNTLPHRTYAWKHSIPTGLKASPKATTPHSHHHLAKGLVYDHTLAQQHICAAMKTRREPISGKKVAHHICNLDGYFPWIISRLHIHEATDLIRWRSDSSD